MGNGLGTKNDLIVKVVFASVFGNFIGKFLKGNYKVRLKLCDRDFKGNELQFSVPLNLNVFKKEKQRAESTAWPESEAPCTTAELGDGGLVFCLFSHGHLKSFLILFVIYKAG